MLLLPSLTLLSFECCRCDEGRAQAEGGRCRDWLVGGQTSLCALLPRVVQTMSGKSYLSARQDLSVVVVVVVGMRRRGWRPGGRHTSCLSRPCPKIQRDFPTMLEGRQAGGGGPAFESATMQQKSTFDAYLVRNHIIPRAWACKASLQAVTAHTTDAPWVRQVLSHRRAVKSFS